ncbi:sodium-dependent nutrient amino acid transporter 1-like [Leptidea sinapis]|uniref:sodium-dependent nutrient amino acid transporter 1-like n=1 Tax=Leptidea sinapis TaxID=189913 RepID=UPI002144B13B|nr:sodium-dependent nutrient amino acid transporter 1-like [Leptidea sinapis]
MYTRPRVRSTNIEYITRSTSISFTDKNELTDTHFRWESIKKFLYLAYASSSSIFTFDIFSGVTLERVFFLDYCVGTLAFGMSYMIMDFFIKQYTRKLDTSESLNPLLRGVSFGILCQTVLWALLNSLSLADSLRFMSTNFRDLPSWMDCSFVTENRTCISDKDVLVRCRSNTLTDVRNTSAHVNYERLFILYDRHNVSVQCFVIASVWLGVFFIATITTNSLLKFLRLSFLWSVFSTLLVVFCLLISAHTLIVIAFYQLMDLRDLNFAQDHSMKRMNEMFSVGLIGVYDFGAISPYTMVDTTVLIFGTVSTILALARSLIMRVLYLSLSRCVKISIAVTPHYLLFVLLPLSAEFTDLHNLYTMYVYVYMTVVLTPGLVMMMLTVTKLLHNEIPSVKSIYITGVLCFLGFSLSIPLSMMPPTKMRVLLIGHRLCTCYLGSFKTLLVMWVYGVKNFCTDVQFWLGFKPTKLWRWLWCMLPVLFLILAILRFFELLQVPDFSNQLWGLIWIIISMLIVTFFQIKTISRYILRNNLMGIFRSNSKYGPPEPKDRKLRKSFDESILYRQCNHDCIVLTEKIECNHLPLMNLNKLDKLSENSSSLASLQKIYDASENKKKTSSVLGSTLHINN